MRRKRVARACFQVAFVFAFLNGGIGHAAEEDAIVIAVPTALGSIEGRDGWMIVQQAVEEINARGGITVGGNKRLLKAFSIDTREHEPGIPVHDALTAVEKIILERKPNAILIGAFRSEVLLASMDLIAKYKIPYICSIAMTPLFQKKVMENYDGYKYMFRTCLTAAYFVEYLTKVMEFLNKEFGFKKAHIVVQDVLWAAGSGAGVEKWCGANGWEVTGLDKYAVGSTDFSPSLIKAKAGKSQVIVPVGDMPQLAILAKQARAMKVPALLCGEIAALCPAYSWDTTQGDIDGFVNFIFESGNIAVKAIPKSVDFIQKFEKRWGKGALDKLSGHGPGPTYDSVFILANAIERAGSLDPEAIVSALEKTDMEGAIGRIRFTKDHQVPYGDDPKETAVGVAIQHRKPGIRVPVYPPAVAEGKIELPDYMK
jgi:branched-chain amino acid transport system substrate-binding protein